jgi:hypothetical protein
MTSVNFANLGVLRSVWNPANTPVDPNLAKNSFQNDKNGKTCGKSGSSEITLKI